METVTARLPDEMIKKLELIAEEEHIDRSEMIRRALDIGIQQFLLERALKAYRARKVSLWKAASMAGLPLRAMMAEADKASIPISYDEEDLERDLAFVKETERGQ
jgi:predicted HTH domain antitoxin